MKIFAKFILGVMASAALTASLTGCGKHRTGWTLKGTIEGAADSMLVVERNNGTYWVSIDSVKADKKGNFKYKALQSEAGYQNIYRLRLGDRMVYFPVEATEEITLLAQNVNMDEVHTLSGSAAAEGFSRVDSLIYAAVERVGAENAVNDSLLLHQLGDVIINDTTCIVSFYTIQRPIKDRHIFTTDDRFKSKLIGAAANRYRQLRPNDKNGLILLDLYNAANARLRGGQPVKGVTMEAQIKGRPSIDFVRKDVNGTPVDLNAILDRGGVTVMNILRYDDPAAPAYTIALNEVYEKYKGRGLEIVQVGIDSSESFWRQHASGMPWVTMFSQPEDAIELMIAYNANPIDGGPTVFIFDTNGELKARVDNAGALMDAVDKVFK